MKQTQNLIEGRNRTLSRQETAMCDAFQASYLYVADDLEVQKKRIKIRRSPGKLLTYTFSIDLSQNIPVRRKMDLNPFKITIWGCW